MGYMGNHLATVSTGAFAAVLTGLWPVFVDYSPILNFIFIMAVPITWFLTFTCWISQKSADYMHNRHVDPPAGPEKKSLSGPRATQVYAPDGEHASIITEAKTELSEELNQLKATIKLKDGEIERLNEEISSLQTLVQIESLKTELANLKALASEQDKS